MPLLAPWRARWIPAAALAGAAPCLAAAERARHLLRGTVLAGSPTRPPSASIGQLPRWRVPGCPG